MQVAFLSWKPWPPKTKTHPKKQNKTNKKIEEEEEEYPTASSLKKGSLSSEVHVSRMLKWHS